MNFIVSPCFCVTFVPLLLWFRLPSHPDLIKPGNLFLSKLCSLRQSPSKHPLSANPSADLQSILRTIGIRNIQIPMFTIVLQAFRIIFFPQVIRYIPHHPDLVKRLYSFFCQISFLNPTFPICPKLTDPCAKPQPRRSYFIRRDIQVSMLPVIFTRFFKIPLPRKVPEAAPDNPDPL